MAVAKVDERSDSTELVPVAAPAPVTLFRTENPNEVVTRAAETANALAAVVKAKKLTTNIQGRHHVRVEGWTLLGSMLGVFPICVWSKKLENGWEARVEARTLGGQLVGAAEAQCLRSEKTWANRDDYALRSMAQTRATSKALRQPLGFVMTMAGFEPTPAEEMVVVDAEIVAEEDDGKFPDVTSLELRLTALATEYAALDSTFSFEGEKKAADTARKKPKYADWLVREVAGLDAHVAKLREALSASEGDAESQFKIPEPPA